MTNEYDEALAALEQMRLDMVEYAEHKYGHALDYPSMKRRYDRDVEFAHEQAQIVRKALITLKEQTDE